MYRIRGFFLLVLKSYLFVFPCRFSDQRALGMSMRVERASLKQVSDTNVLANESGVRAVAITKQLLQKTKNKKLKTKTKKKNTLNVKLLI